MGSARKHVGFFALAVLYLGGDPRPSAGQLFTIIEIRRTFRSPECDSGEFYVNGRRIALFQADPAFFAKPGRVAKLFFGKIATQSINDATLFYRTVPSVVVSDANESKEFTAAMLDRIPNAVGSSTTQYSFSLFAKPRARMRRLPADMIVLGSSLSNRSCEITSVASPPFDAGDGALERVTDRVGDSVFHQANLSANLVRAAPRKLRCSLVTVPLNSRPSSPTRRSITHFRLCQRRTLPTRTTPASSSWSI